MTYRHINSMAAICDITEPVELHMLNGTDMKVAVPCFYLIDGEQVPVDLTAEGYIGFTLAVDVEYAGFSGSAAVDPENANVIFLQLEARCPDATDSDIDIDFALLSSRSVPDKPTWVDALLRGKIVVVGSPLPAFVD